VQSDTVRITFKQMNQGVNDHNALISGINLYPNPSDGIFNLSFNARMDGSISLSLFSSDGREVWRSAIPVKPGINTYLISQTHLPSGIYLIKLSGAGGTFYRKAVIH